MENINSLGNKIATSNEKLSLFLNWFKGSVATDNGKPLVLYHGSKNGIKNGFEDKFMFLTYSPTTALTYTRTKDNVLSVYAKIFKPYSVDFGGRTWNQLIPNTNMRYTDMIVNKIFSEHPEYDSIVFKNVIDRGPFYHKGTKFESVTNIVVKNASEQIRLCSDFIDNSDNDKNINSQINEVLKIAGVK